MAVRLEELGGWFVKQAGEREGLKIGLKEKNKYNILGGKELWDLWGIGDLHWRGICVIYSSEEI